MADDTEMRQLNVRLPVELFDQIEAIRQVEAATDGQMSTAQLLRDVLEEFVERRRKDPKFQARRKAAVAEHIKLLDSLK